MNRNKRLYRSRKDRQIAGVCGGIADYLAIDPTLVRLFWALFALAGGPGIVLSLSSPPLCPKNPNLCRHRLKKSRTTAMFRRAGRGFPLEQMADGFALGLEFGFRGFDFFGGIGA